MHLNTQRQEIIIKKQLFGIFTAFNLFLKARMQGVRQRRAYRRAYERVLLEGRSTFQKEFGDSASRCRLTFCRDTLTTSAKLPRANSTGLAECERLCEREQALQETAGAGGIEGDGQPVPGVP